jgi:hypothetical protein
MLAVMEDRDSAVAEAVSRAAHGSWLYSRLPSWFLDTLSNKHKEALHQALTDPDWGRHLVNIRISAPVLRRRYYITVVGGALFLTAERRAHDHHRYPLRTVANIFFFVGLAAAFYAVALVALAIFSVVIEF